MDSPTFVVRSRNETSNDLHGRTAYGITEMDDQLSVPRDVRRYPTEVHLAGGLNAMTLNNSLINSTSGKKTVCGSGIVENGHSNLVSGVNSEARRTVEAKYAEEWNAAGLVRRWKLHRKMNAEIEELAAKLMPEVSPDTMF